MRAGMRDGQGDAGRGRVSPGHRGGPGPGVGRWRPTAASYRSWGAAARVRGLSTVRRRLAGVAVPLGLALRLLITMAVAGIANPIG